MGEQNFFPLSWIWCRSSVALNFHQWTHRRKSWNFYIFKLTQWEVQTDCLSSACHDLTFIQFLALKKKKLKIEFQSPLLLDWVNKQGSSLYGPPQSSIQCQAGDALEVGWGTASASQKGLITSCMQESCDLIDLSWRLGLEDWAQMTVLSVLQSDRNVPILIRIFLSWRVF